MPIYSYAELKGKIKVGDRVRAVKGEANNCSTLQNDGSNSKDITYIDVDGFCIDACWHRYIEPGFLELLTEEKTLDTVDVGDVVVDESGGERTIMDKSLNGTILFLSQANDPTGYNFALTRQQLKEYSYTVKQSTPEPKEMTLEEVSKALGYPVKIVE